MSARSVLKRLIVAMPLISRFYKQRNALIAEREEFLATLVAKIKDESRTALKTLGGEFYEPSSLTTYRPDRIQQIKSALSGVQGWVGADSGTLLYFLIREKLEVPTVVELGAWKGRSTIWLASALKDRSEDRDSPTGKVYAVDTWRGTQNEADHRTLLRGYAPHQLFDEFRQNIAHAGVAAFVEPIRATTDEAARLWPRDMPIGLLFIDADHAYEAVKRDFASWSPFVAAGGFIVFDDVPKWHGPTRLVLEMPQTYRPIGASGNQFIIQKSQQ
jgi:predicted O-methyltransferase YrrM